MSGQPGGEKGEIWRNCSRSARPNHFLLGHFPQWEGNELEFRFRSTEGWTSGIALRGWVAVVAAFGRSVAISGAHTSYRAQSTPSPYCCHLKVFYCWCKNRPKSSLSQKKRGTSWTFFFLQELLHFSISFFHFWQAAKPVIDICFDWQKYQNIKPSSFNNQAVSYVFGTVCKRIVQSLFRSKERKNKLNDRNKLLWGSDAYPIIQSKVLTKDETEEKKE